MYSWALRSFAFVTGSKDVASGFTVPFVHVGPLVTVTRS
jgi:hypothetical protein